MKESLKKWDPKIQSTKKFIEFNFISIFVVFALILFVWKKRKTEITFDELMRILENGEFEHLWIEELTNQKMTVKSVCLVKTTNGRFWVESLDQNLLMKRLNELKHREEPETVTWNRVTLKTGLSQEKIIESIASWISILGFIGLFVIPILARGKSGQTFSNSMDFKMTSKVKKFKKEKVGNVKFGTVAGMDSTKQEIEEFVDFLKNPKKFQAVGAKLPKGALLSGPPGTGKTMLAKAVAAEAGVPFYFASGSEFVEMFVGLGASRVRELFNTAKESPSAIIFIDEIDAIGKKRAGKLSSNAESDATLNQLLVEMDGFSSSSNVVVFGATNRADLLDPALVRPGRFDRTIEINLPDISARAEIFKVHLKPLILADESRRDQFSRRLAALTPGFSGADISNICNEAGIHAVRRKKEAVEDIDFEMAVERVLGGLPTNRSISEEERKTVAVHESGHGVVSWFLKGASPLLKLTIIPRSKGALGFAQYLPNEIPLQTEEFLVNQIVSILAGRAAEKEFFGKTSTGAYDDLQKAYRIARAIVTKLGMNKKIGQIVFVENDYGIKDYSETSNREIDVEIGGIIKNCSAIAAEMVKTHRDKIQRMSDILLEKETIDLKIIQEVLGERPFETEAIFKAYLEESKPMEATS